jgi:uncharacterized membrane protein YkoI
MRNAWLRVVALAIGLLVVGGWQLHAGASGNQASLGSPSSLVASAKQGATDVAEWLGIGEEQPVAPGTLDDGKELLPQTTLTVEQAVKAAQSAATGAVGEVDLEHFHGRLVFNVDIGDKDVKVDAENGNVLSDDSDD